MWTAAWKGLLGHRLRFALTALSIALGVGLIAASYMFTDSLDAAFGDLFNTTLSGFDLQVRGEVDEELSFVQGAPLPEALVAEIRATPGVTAASGSIVGFVNMASDGESLAPGNTLSFVVSWPELVDAFELRSGNRPQNQGEGALDPATAQRAGLAIGDEITATGVGAPIPIRVTGTASIEGFDSFGGAVSLYVPLAAAQELLGLSGQVLTIEVETDQPIEAMVERIGPVLPEGVEVVSAQSAAEEQLATFKEALGFINTFLLVFAGVTVFVAAFLIQNTFRIIVAQRTQELATLRLVGATRRQVLGMVMVEAGLVGLLASALGLGLGVLLAGLIRRLLNFGGTLPDSPFTLAPRTVAVAVATGLVITAGSALLPARGASRIPPIAALRLVHSPDSAATNRRRSLVGGALAILGIGFLAAGLIGFDLPLSDITLVGIGAGLIFIGVAVLTSVWARPITSRLGRPLLGLGVTGRLAVDNAGRAPRRTAATASALMVGLALVGLTLVLADSLSSTADRLIGDRFRADLVVAPAGLGGGGLSPVLAEGLDSLPEVALVAPVRDGQVLFDGESRTMLGGDTDKLGDLVNFTVEAGAIADVTDDRIGLREGLIDNARIGDQVTVEFARTGRKTFSVAAIFSARGLGASLLVDRETFVSNFTEQFDSQIFVGLAEGVSVDQGKEAVESALQETVGIQVFDQGELATEAGERIDELVLLVFGLLGVAVVIAVIGITNTLTLSVIERRREIGLLRAVGLSRRQLRAAISWEAVLIALLGAVLGMGLGLIFAWAVITAIESEVLRLSIPWDRVGWALAGAALAGLLAAAIPAWRASKKNILEAIAYE